MVNTLEIACLQTRPMPDFDTAIEEAIGLATAAVDSGAKIIFLSEYCGGLQTKGARLVPPAAPSHAHPVVNALKGFAADTRVFMMVGSVAVEGQSGKIINRGFMIDDHGRIMDHYDKIHMFDIQLSETEIFRESDTVDPGNRAVIHDCGGARIGHTICYDLRFPHLYRTLAQNGADILAVPAAFTKKTGEAHWHALNRARAIENGAFVVSPCAIGSIPGGGESYGHSLIINPWGEVIADGGDQTGVIRASIDLDEVAKARTRIPSLTHDRPIHINTKPKRNVA